MLGRPGMSGQRSVVTRVVRGRAVTKLGRPIWPMACHGQRSSAKTSLIKTNFLKKCNWF